MFESISNITHPMQTLFIYILVRLLFLKVSEEVAHMQALIHIHREKKTPIHVSHMQSTNSWHSSFLSLSQSLTRNHYSLLKPLITHALDNRVQVKGFFPPRPFLYPILLNGGHGLYSSSTTISLCTWSTVDSQNNDKILQLYIVEKARHVIIIMSLHQRILQTKYCRFPRLFR